MHGLTDELLAALTACGAERVLIAFDRDEAGDRGAEAIAKQLTAAGLDAFRLLFPKGEDANSYVRAVGPATKSLGVVIRSAEWLGQGAAPTRSVPAVHEPEIVPMAAAAESLPPLAAEPVLPEAPLLLADEVPSIEAVPEPPAVAVPEAASPEPIAEASEQQLVVVYGARRYRVRGWPKQLGEALKVNVLVSVHGGVQPEDDAGPQGLHVDTLDLYQAKQRAAFARASAAELSVEEPVIQHDLGRLLLKLETVIEERAKAAEQSVPPPAAMSETQMSAALALLKDPALIERIVEDVERVGLVGEPANALVAYLACVSRKLGHPLAVLIQSTSAAGKSTLMDTLLSLVPEEDRVQYSAMTGQSLFYLGETDLKHKILAIAEEEGVRQAAYALKVLQSQGELTIASTGKDPATGMLVTQQYRVEGPVMLCLTTTAIDVDEELVNRCLVLTINESREQTRAIQQRQRQARTLAGLVATSEANMVREIHQNAQRLLRPLAVVNPYAEQLTFLDDRTRTRRDHAKYLTLIEAIALAHQHQRTVRTTSAGGKPIEYIEVQLADIELANRLAHDVLGRSLDELPPQTRRVLGLIESFVAETAAREAMKPADVRFTRRQLRERCGMSDAAVRVHLDRLLALEYVRAAVGRNGQRFEYELLFDGDMDRSDPQLIGLIDVAALKAARTMPTSQGSEADPAPRLQAARAPLAPTLQGAVDAPKSYEKSLASVVEPQNLGNARTGIDPMPGRSRTVPARGSSIPLAANGLSPGA